MNNFKIKVSAMALLLSMMIVGVNAQPAGQRHATGKPQQPHEQKSPEKIAEMRTDKLDQDLDLSDSQEKKIYAINLKVAKEAAAAREAAIKEREAKMKERQAQKPGEGQKPTVRPSREEMQAKMKARAQEMAAKREAYHMDIMSNLKDAQKMKYAMAVARAEAKQQMHKAKQGAKKQGVQQKGKKGGRPQQGQKGKRPQHKKPVNK